MITSFPNELSGDSLPSLLLNLNSYIASSSSYDWTRSSTKQNSPGLAFDSPPIFADSIRKRLLIVSVQVYIQSISDMDSSIISQSSGYGLLQFLVNPLPNASDVSVTVTPAVGTSLTTYFSINCSGGSAVSMPLSYSIGYLTGDFDILNIAQTELAGACQWLLIKNPVCALVNYKLFLPVGSTLYKYTNIICIGVSDAVGSIIYYFSRSVTVYPSKTNASVCTTLIFVVIRVFIHKIYMRFFNSNTVLLSNLSNHKQSPHI